MPVSLPLFAHLLAYLFFFFGRGLHDGQEMKEARRKMPRAFANARAPPLPFDHPHFSWLPPPQLSRSFLLEGFLTVHTSPLFCAPKPSLWPLAELPSQW